eukprot:IDg9754t1
MWKVDGLIYDQFTNLGEKLSCVLGNKKNCEDFYASLQTVYRLRLTLFSIHLQGVIVVPEKKQLRSPIIELD